MHVVAGRDLVCKTERGEKPSSEIPVSLEVYSCSTLSSSGTAFALASQKETDGSEASSNDLLMTSLSGRCLARIESLRGYAVKSRTQGATRVDTKANYMYTGFLAL